MGKRQSPDMRPSSAHGEALSRDAERIGGMTQFAEWQVAAPKAKLDPSYVATRKQAGRELSYIEGWHAISEANRIFGFDGGHRETVELKETSRDLVTVPGYGGKPDYDQWRISYIAKVRITVGDIVREGTGYGS